MSTVLEIKSALAELPKQEFWKLAKWFDGLRERTWDGQILADSQNGKLDFLFMEAKAARRAGDSRHWPRDA